MDVILDLEKAILDICDGDISHEIKLARKIVTLEVVIKAFEELGENNG